MVILSMPEDLLNFDAVFEELTLLGVAVEDREYFLLLHQYIHLGPTMKLSRLCSIKLLYQSSRAVVSGDGCL